MKHISASDGYQLELRHIMQCIFANYSAHLKSCRERALDSLRGPLSPE